MRTRNTYYGDSDCITCSNTDAVRQSLNDELPFIHYSNPYYKQGRTIFGKEEENLSYAYDDRLMSWSYENHKRGEERAKKVAKNTANYWQEYLRGYHEDDKLELRHIVGGYNLSNGYTYYAFGYKISKKET